MKHKDLLTHAKARVESIQVAIDSRFDKLGSVETTEYYTKICQSVDVVCYTSE
jgi:hypothetical protein